MRFFKTVMLAAVTAGVMASEVSAQTPVQITINQADWVYKATTGGLNGGGWEANITGIPANLTVPDDLIVYCFDSKRQFRYGETMNYVLLTFDDFLNNVGVVGGGGVRDAQWNTISVLDLNYMVEQTANYVPGASAGNNNTQANIWGASNNGVLNASPFNTAADAYSSSWMILVDKAEWERGLDYTLQGHQSFLVNIGSGSVVTPEPSTYALMGAGLVALFVASRRRRQTNV